MGIEAFTVLAVLDAQDRASKVFERAAAVLTEFTGSMDRAAATAEAAGTVIDESLLKTASGVDALQLANIRVAAAQEEQRVATVEQAQAEQSLIDMMTNGIVFDDELAAATDRLALAEKNAASAATDLEAAQSRQAAITKQLDLAQADASLSADALAVSQGRTAAASLAASGSTEEAALASSSAGTSYLAIGALFAGAGVLALKAAGDYQSSTTHLVTDAGEAANKLKMVQDGILNLAPAVGFSANTMSTAMYHVESAGFHAQAGLDVLRIAAEGAKVGNADLDSTTKTLSGTLDAYKDKNYSASQMMNMMIETTAQGDMHMQDLTTSLGAVGPVAAAAGIDFAQVGGALATMTAQNMTTQQATQNLAHLIVSLQKPTSIMSDEAQGLGLNMDDLSSKLGERGLTGTLKIMVQAIADHNKGGQIFVNSLNESTAAADSANKMLSLMPDDLKKISESLANGGMSVKDYTKAIAGMGPQADEKGKQFLTLTEKMGAFNKQMTSGTGLSQTFNSALDKLTGGQVGLKTSLMLTADGGRYFNEATQNIADSAGSATGEVKNWSTIQQTFNFQLDKAKASVEALGVKIGMILLPYVQKMVSWLSTGAEWLTKHKLAAESLALVIGGVLVGAVVGLGSAFLVAFGPEIAITLGIMALAAALVYAYTHVKKFHEIVNTLGTYLAAGFKAAWKSAGEIIDWFRSVVLPKLIAGIKDVFDWFESHKEGFKQSWDSVLHAVQEVVKWFDDNVLSWIKSRIDEFMTWWRSHSQEIHEVWNDVWRVVKTIVEVWWDGFMRPTLTVIAAVWGVVWGGIKDTLKMIWDIISGIISTAIHWIENTISVVLDIITGNWGKAWHDLSHMVSQAWNDVTGLFGNIINDSENMLWDAGVNIIHGLINGIKGSISGITNVMGDVTQTIKDHLPWSPAKRGPLSGSGALEIAGGNISKMLATGIRSSTGVVASAASAMASAARPNMSASTLLGGGMSAFGASAGGAGSGAIVFDMRWSQIMSDRDMDVFADRVGRRIATRILPAGGVRIRM